MAADFFRAASASFSFRSAWCLMVSRTRSRTSSGSSLWYSQISSALAKTASSTRSTAESAVLGFSAMRLSCLSLMRGLVGGAMRTVRGVVGLPLVGFADLAVRGQVCRRFVMARSSRPTMTRRRQI